MTQLDALLNAPDGASDAGASAPRFVDVEAIFAAFGGVPVVAGLTGMKPNAAIRWKYRNSIPVDHWPALISSGPGQLIGLTADDLMRACAAPKGKSDTQNGQGEAA